METSLVIVALPAEDDYINKISSQQVAHMTLLFLGDVSKVQNLDRITSFVEHAANQMLKQFNLGVDRRGVLGTDLADVIFFKKSWYCFNDVNSFRSALLQENDIRAAYDSNNQYDEWQPHLTLGYPDSPANPDDRDYPGIYNVNFDRIAVWYKEFGGDEFLLESNDEYMMMSVGKSVVGEILEHHGVLGMKWGRRSGTASAISAKGSHSVKGKKTERFSNALDNTIFELVKNSDPVTNHIALNASTRFKKDLPAIKAKHGDYAKLHNRIKKPFSKEAKAYRKDVKENYLKHLEESANELTNDKRTRQYTLSEYGTPNTSVHFWKVETQVIRHDGSGMSVVRPIYDSEGWIIDLKVIDDSMDSFMAQSAIDHVLAHHGTDKI